VVAGRDRRHGDLGRMVLHRGPRPYGYFGFGELFVFVYFGLVATVGTAYVQHLTVPNRSWWLGVATGFMACALLEANNLRDVEGDRSSGKKTLAARMNRGHAPWLFATCVLGVLVAIAGPDTSCRHRGDPALHSCGPPGVLEQERTRALADVEVFGASPVATRRVARRRARVQNWSVKPWTSAAVASACSR